MDYRDHHVRNLIDEAITAYNRIPLPSRKLSIPHVEENFSRYEDYQQFITPVNKLVEMGVLDFDARNSLEDIVKLLKTTPLSKAKF